MGLILFLLLVGGVGYWLFSNGYLDGIINKLFGNDSGE